MTREDKYPNTDTFRFYNANPKNRITGDCVTRAISVATEEDYNKIVMARALVHIETGYDSTVNEGISVLMEKLGWTKMKQPKKPNGKKYTGKEWCKYLNKEYPEGVRMVANIGGHHIVAIVPKVIDGKMKHRVYDIWDSTRKCIGNYWIKEQENRS